MTWPLIIPEDKFLPYCSEVGDHVNKLKDLGFEVRYVPREFLRSMPDSVSGLNGEFELKDICQVFFQGTPKGWENLPSNNEQLTSDATTERNKDKNNG